MKKYGKLLALLLSVILCLSACGGSSSSGTPAASTPAGSTPAADNSGRALNLSILAALTTLNPLNSNNLQDTMFLQQMNSGLFHVNEITKEVEPRVAESWTISEDGKTYTFKLRSNAKFHNGDPVKASDCVWSFNYAMGNPRINTYYTSVESVEAADDSTFIMHLKNPNGAIFATLSNYNYILSEREATEQGDAFGTKLHTASCGPYKLTRLDGLDSYWELEAFEDYFLGAPAIKKLTYKPISEASAGLIAFESCSASQ